MTRRTVVADARLSSCNLLAVNAPSGSQGWSNKPTTSPTSPAAAHDPGHDPPRRDRDRGTCDTARMASIAEIADTLASFTLFSDLSRPQLEAVIHALDEEWYSEGQRVLRQGFTGGGFYVILDGEATVRIDGHDRARLSRGDFFGEISILLDEPPVADVVAVGALRCLVLARTDLHDWLRDLPTVAFRMLQAEARRLRAANSQRL